MTAERTAVEKAASWAERILDPWHEGFHETTEKHALDQLAAATRSWLASEDLEPATELAGALAEAVTATGGAAVFNAIGGLWGALRRYCAAIGQPLPQSTGD